MKNLSKELWTKSQPETFKSKQNPTTLMSLLQLWFIECYFYLRQWMSHFYVISPENSQSVSWETKNGYYSNPLMPCCPVGLSSERSFTGNLSAWPAVTHWEKQICDCWNFELSFTSKWREQLCVFTGHIELLKPHFALTQIRASETEAECKSHEPQFLFWSLRYSVSRYGPALSAVLSWTAANRGKVLPQAIWGKVLLWIVQGNWILGQFTSHPATPLTLRTADWAPLQLLIEKKVLASFLCRYWFHNLFIV